MPYSAPHTAAPLREILALRVRVYLRHTLAREQAAQASLAVLLLLLLPAAFALGKNAEKAIHRPDAPSVLFAALLLLHAGHVLLLLAGGRIGLLPERIPVAVLRPLPTSAVDRWASEALLYLVSLPTLTLLTGLLPLAAHGGVRVCAPLFLLELLGVGWALLLPRAAGALARFRGGRVSPFVLAAVALAGAYGLAFFAPSSALASALDGSRPAGAHRLWRGDSAPPPTKTHASLPAALRFSPPGLAADAITGHGLVWATGALVLIVAAVGTLAFRLEVGLGEALPASGSGAAVIGRRQIAGGMLATEIRLLLRDTRAHLPLREPALLLFLILLGIIMANPAPEPARNVADLAGIAPSLYAAIYQVQLLCNRFGSESGTAGLRFSLGTSPWRDLLVKNTALLVLFFGADAAVVAAFAPPSRWPDFLRILAALLVLATALGNVVSRLAPFPIAAARCKAKRGPERALLFGYALFFAGVWGLYQPASWLAARGGAILGTLAAALYVAAVYALSVGVAAAGFSSARERRFVAVLDGIA